MTKQTKSVARREESVVTVIRPAAVPAKAATVPVARKPEPRALLGLLFVVGALGLGWFAWKSGDESKPSRLPARSRDASQIDAVVNKHLLMTNTKLELERERARLDNNDSIPEVGEQILPRWKPQQVVGVDHSPDRNELNAQRDLEQAKEYNLNSPDVIIQTEMADSEKRHEYEAKYKEEYARRFIENARAGGYEIELDDNFVVKKVRKIAPDDPNSLFTH